MVNTFLEVLHILRRESDPDLVDLLLLLLQAQLGRLHPVRHLLFREKITDPSLDSQQTQMKSSFRTLSSQSPYKKLKASFTPK